MMNLKHVACAIAAVSLLCATPALAKKKISKSRGGKITGVYCAQGPDNAYFPASSFKPAQRARMYKGLKAKINIAGFGPIDCVVY
jgi:hypothetical protein